MKQNPRSVENEEMKISIVIPVYNEERKIGHILSFLILHAHNLLAEIIVVNANSTDLTEAVAQKAGKLIKVVNTTYRHRARQMNEGASKANGDILFFLHVDSIPPENYSKLIVKSMNAHKLGCFRLKFDWKHWFLRANSWFTRFNINAFRFGDQGLFIQKKLFEKYGGYSKNHLLLEDQEIVQRITKKEKFIVLQQAVVTSARKYREIGVYKLQLIYFFIYFLYRFGSSQAKLMRIYEKMVSQPIDKNALD